MSSKPTYIIERSYEAFLAYPDGRYEEAVLLEGGAALAAWLETTPDDAELLLTDEALALIDATQ